MCVPLIQEFVVRYSIKFAQFFIIFKVEIHSFDFHVEALHYFYMGRGPFKLSVATIFHDFIYIFPFLSLHS